jgi:hypothetical protein
MYFRKRSLEELPQESTPVWSCTKESCNGWMRDNFAFEHVPVCTQCASPMVSGMKMLPSVVNTNVDIKSMKKGVTIG